MAIIIIKMRTPNKYLEISGVSEDFPNQVTRKWSVKDFENEWPEKDLSEAPPVIERDAFNEKAQLTETIFTLRTSLESNPNN